MTVNKAVKQTITFLFIKNIMERQRPLSQAIICTVFLCLFSVFLPLYTAVAQQPDSPAPVFFTNEISILKKRIAAHEQNEAEARQALEEAGKALDLAIKKNNTAAQDISRQAIALSEEALSDVRKQKARDHARLKAIEASLKWKSIGTDFGIACIVKGEVFKKTRSGMIPFDGNSPIGAGDIIGTGKNGFLEVALPDHSYVSMGANTSIEISELNRDKKQSLYTILRTGVARGKLNIQAHCLQHGRAADCWTPVYKITKLFAASIRGTEFNIEQNSDSSTTLIVFEGVIEVTDTNTNKPVTVSAMEQLLIRQDGSIHGPIPVKTDSIQRWWEIFP